MELCKNIATTRKIRWTANKIKETWHPWSLWNYIGCIIFGMYTEISRSMTSGWYIEKKNNVKIDSQYYLKNNREYK